MLVIYSFFIIFIQTMTDDDLCGVCYEHFDSSTHKDMVLECTHHLCMECAQSLTQPSCPFCRTVTNWAVAAIDSHEAILLGQTHAPPMIHPSAAAIEEEESTEEDTPPPAVPIPDAFVEEERDPREMVITTLENMMRILAYNSLRNAFNADMRSIQNAIEDGDALQRRMLQIQARIARRHAYEFTKLMKDMRTVFQPSSDAVRIARFRTEFSRRSHRR